MRNKEKKKKKQWDETNGVHKNHACLFFFFFFCSCPHQWLYLQGYNGNRMIGTGREEGDTGLIDKDVIEGAKDEHIDTRQTKLNFVRHGSIETQPGLSFGKGHGGCTEAFHAGTHDTA